MHLCVDSCAGAGFGYFVLGKISNLFYCCEALMNLMCIPVWIDYCIGHPPKQLNLWVCKIKFTNIAYINIRTVWILVHTYRFNCSIVSNSHVDYLSVWIVQVSNCRNYSVTCRVVSDMVLTKCIGILFLFIFCITLLLSLNEKPKSAINIWLTFNAILQQ